MNIDYFPGCCNALVLYDFGGTSASLFENRDKHDDNAERFLDNAIKKFSDVMLVATTNNQQVEMNRLLEDRGFKRTDWMHKNQHPETMFVMWWREPNYDSRLIKLYWKGEKDGEPV